MSKIVKSRQSCSNGHLPYHCLFHFLARALDAWRGVNLVPRGPFCHALEISGPLARPNDIPVLNGCVNTIDYTRTNQVCQT